MVPDQPLAAALSDTHAPAALQRDAGRYHALMQAAGQIVWTANAQGQIEEDIPMWRAYTGQAPNEVLGNGWLDAVHPADRAQVAQSWATALQQRGTYEALMRVRRADGAYRTFAARAAPVLEADGAVREWVGHGADITAQADARAAAEAQAERNAQLYAEEQQARAKDADFAREMEATFAAMTEGVAIYGPSGALRYMNPAFEQIFAQFAAPESEPLPLHERLAAFAPHDAEGNVLPPDQYPIHRLLRGEVIAFAAPATMLLPARDGKMREMSVSGAPMRDDAGNVTGAVAIIHDVTQQRHLERRTHAALDALLQMAEALVNPPSPQDLFSRSGIFVPQDDQDDAAAQVVQVSAAQLVFLIRAVLDCDVVGMVTITPESEALAPVSVVGLTIAAEQQWRVDATRTTLTKFVHDASELARLRAGEMVYWDRAHSAFSRLPNYGVQTLLLAPMQLGDHLIGLLGIEHRDQNHHYTLDELALVRAVTQLATLVFERARLQHDREEAVAKEGALRETNRQMTDFLSIVSHEIKTPLTSIKAAIQFAERRMKRFADHSAGTIRLTQQEFDDVLSLLGRADSQVNVQNRLVEDLLDASRIQTGRLELRTEPADLAAIVRNIVEEQRIVWESRTITLDLPDPALAPITADAMRIGQVVANFLTNALKYSASALPVAVRLVVVGDVARVSVTDQGPGLPPDELASVWQRFHRAKGITVQSGSGVGLGLGLYICKSFIERHHGQVGVVSAPGQGSTFWFELPVTPQG